MTTFGVDVSKWQDPPLNWAGMRDNKGISFMFARASLGTIPDSTYRAHVSQAARAGLETGAYHYQWPNVSPADAVRVFLNQIGPLTDQEVTLDVEEKGTTWGMVKAWAREWDRQTGGYPLGIYISRGYWTRIGKPLLADYFDYLWLAYWPTGGYPGDDSSVWTTKVGGLKPTVWQYGVRRASGLKLDGNAFRGTIQQYRQIASGYQLPDTNTGDSMSPLEIESMDPVLVHVPAGATYFSLDGAEIRANNNDIDKISPYQVVIGNRHFRVVNAKVDGATSLVLVQLKDISFEPIPEPVDDTPYSQADLDTAVEDAIAADRAKATVGIIYQENA